MPRQTKASVAVLCGGRFYYCDDCGDYHPLGQRDVCHIKLYRFAVDYLDAQVDWLEVTKDGEEI